MFMVLCFSLLNIIIMLGFFLTKLPFDIFYDQRLNHYELPPKSPWNLNGTFPF